MIRLKQSSLEKGRLWWLLSLAILLRALLMPVTMHSDLIFINYFPYFLSFKGHWDVYGYLGDFYLNQGFTYYPPGLYFLTAFFQYLFHFVNQGLYAFLNNSHTLMHRVGDVARASDYLSPFTPKQLAAIIFLFKLPYLIFESGIIWLLLKMRPKDVNQILIYWVFNPIVIYSSYIMGQYRIYSAFFMTLLIYFLINKKEAFAFIILGLAMCFDNYPLLLLPPMLIWYSETLEKLLKYLISFLFAPLLILGPLLISSKGYVVFAYLSPTIKNVAQQSIINSYPEIIGPLCKLTFIFIYVFIIYISFRRRRKFFEHSQSSDGFMAIALIVFLALYSTSVTHIHYTMWAMPFFVLCVNKMSGNFYRLALFSTLCLFFYNLDQPALNAGLLGPLDPNYFFKLPSLNQLMSPIFPMWGKIVGLARIVFSMLCMFAIFYLTRYLTGDIVRAHDE